MRTFIAGLAVVRVRVDGIGPGVVPVARADSRRRDSRGGHSQTVADNQSNAAGRWRSAKAIRRRWSPTAARSCTAAAIPTRSSPRSISRPARSCGSRNTPSSFTKNQYATQMAKGPELHAARRRQPAVHPRRHRHPHRVECRRRHHRLAAGLFVVDRYLEIVLRHRHVADARRRRADRAGGQRRPRRPRARARSGNRQGAVVVEGPGPRLRVAAGGHHRRRAPDHHDDQWVDRRHQRRQRRVAVVDSVSRRLAREHRHADLDRPSL